jgi:hypothetical protein
MTAEGGHPTHQEKIRKSAQMAHNGAMSLACFGFGLGILEKMAYNGVQWRHVVMGLTVAARLRIHRGETARGFQPSAGADGRRTPLDRNEPAIAIETGCDGYTHGAKAPTVARELAHVSWPERVPQHFPPGADPLGQITDLRQPWGLCP